MDQKKLWGTTLLSLALALSCKQSDAPVPPAQSAGSGGAPLTPGAATVGGDGSVEERLGERGSSCDSTSDCADGLSCVVTHDCPAGVACSNKSCQPSDFDLVGTGKSCHVSDCKTKADCCGDMPLTAPAKCKDRTSICTKPLLAGCTQVRCASSAECGTGTCSGVCSLDSKKCLTTSDCATNTCDTTTEPDTCTVIATDCSLSTCTTNTCSLPYCNCQNPDYDPTNPICTDPDCEDICGFDCKEERCVVDTRCSSDSECATTTPFCSDGQCAQCRTKDDCEDEDCIDGHCGPRCEVDTQCALFEACQGGDCVFVGCRSDRECVLQAANGKSVTSQDPRLAKCDVQNGLGACVFPCDVDAQCAPSEVCLNGVCKYIGCETDAECKTIAGLHNLPVPTPERPWTTTAVCRPDEP